MYALCRIPEKPFTMKRPKNNPLPTFYVTGGTLRHDAPSYVQRRADQSLLDFLLRGEFCYVLTARQMGKSSMMIRTASRLRDCGIGVAVLDLTAVGQNLTPEQWYGGLLVQIGQQLNLEEELIEFWASQTHLGSMQRWINAICKIILPLYPVRIVIFIDEIDAVRNLPFSSDEFFAGIRECYNQRNESADLQRLTFSLLGVATPSDLISNTSTTPFNIGCRIELRDFTQEEIAPLAYGFTQPEKQRSAILKRIFYWTGGHPYLTQRLCQAVAEHQNIRHVSEVDRLCKDLFFLSRARERDDNLLFVQERIRRSEEEMESLLELYARIRKRKVVFDDENNRLVTVLRLSGIIQIQAGQLKVRNRIYEKVFNSKWIAMEMPDAERRRQHAAYRRGIWRTAIVAFFILLIVGGLALLALQQSKNLRQQIIANRQLLYFTQIKLAQQEWENANVNRAEEFLNFTIPQPGMEDLREFEWHLLKRLVHSESGLIPQTCPIVSLTLPEDGKTLVAGLVLRAQRSSPPQYFVKFFDPVTYEEKDSIALAAGSNFDLVSFSPKKQLVALDAPGNQITILDLNSRKSLVCSGLSKAVTAIAFSQDGQSIVAGDLDGNIIIWDTTTGNRKKNLPKFAQWIRSASFSPDGRLLATTDGSSIARVWDVAGGHNLHSFSINEDILSRTIFSPDGKDLLVSSSKGPIYIWNVDSGKRLKILSGHSAEARALAFSKNARILASSGVDRTIKLWDVESGNELRTIRGHGSDVNALVWSGDGKSLISGSSDYTIKVWDIAKQDGLGRLDEPFIKCFAAFFSPNEEVIALGITKEKKLKLCNLSTNQKLAEFNEDGQMILAVAFSPDGKILATAGMSPARTSVSDDSAAQHNPSVIKLWDPLTGKQIGTLKGHTGNVYSLYFSPDGSLLASGGPGIIKLWNVASRQEITSFDRDTNNGFRAVFSPDNKLLASACRYGDIKLWDISSLTHIRTFVGHTDAARTITFSSDSRQLITGGRDNTIRLWDVASGVELVKFGQTGHTRRAAFSSDNKRLVTGGEDGAIKVWDLITRQEMLSLPKHSAQISSISFSANGNLLISSEDGTLRLWLASPVQE
jgi:WD40 repeat protein